MILTRTLRARYRTSKRYNAEIRFIWIPRLDAKEITPLSRFSLILRMGERTVSELSSVILEKLINKCQSKIPAAGKYARS